MNEKNRDFEITPKLVFDMNLALYLDLVAALEGDDGEAGLSPVLEGIAKGFAGRGDGLSIELLKAARGLREDDAMGDIPMRPEDD